MRQRDYEKGGNNCRSRRRPREGSPARRRTIAYWPTSAPGIWRSALDAALKARDAALTAFPEGADAALVAARAALAAGDAEKKKVATEFASLEHTIVARKKRIDAALSGARTDAAQATIAVETAQGQLTTAKTDHASAHGGLIELRRKRDAENLAEAETRLQQAKEQSRSPARP